MTDDPIDGAWAFVTENFRDLALLGIAVAIYYLATDAEPPSVPHWSGLLVVAAIIAGGGALVATGKIWDLLPDDHGIYLPVVNAKNNDLIEVWELTEDKHEDMRVIGGTLNHLSECKHRAYECIHYDPEENVAVATWRRSIDASEIVGHHHAKDALNIVEEIRDDLEPDARYARHLRGQLPSVIRRMDRQRAMHQNAALDPHLTPSFAGENGETMDEMIADALPDDVLPARLKQDEAEALAEDGADGGGLGLELLDDAEALDPVEAVGNGHTNGHEGSE